MNILTIFALCSVVFVSVRCLEEVTIIHPATLQINDTDYFNGLRQENTSQTSEVTSTTVIVSSSSSSSSSSSDSTSSDITDDVATTTTSESTSDLVVPGNSISDNTSRGQLNKYNQDQASNETEKTTQINEYRNGDSRTEAGVKLIAGLALLKLFYSL